MRAAAVQIRDSGIGDVAIVGIFSPLDIKHRQEDEVAQIVKDICGPLVNITVSHKVAQIGFLERENATILNASILPLARRTIREFHTAFAELDLEVPL